MDPVTVEHKGVVLTFTQEAVGSTGARCVKVSKIGSTKAPFSCQGVDLADALNLAAAYARKYYAAAVAAQAPAAKE